MTRRARYATLLLLLAATACGSSAGGGGRSLRVGAFQNLTHAPALLALADGTFEDSLGYQPEISWFNAGGAAVEAMFAGQIDVAFVGPGPAISAFEKSHGEAIRIVSGVAIGGTGLVTTQGITDPVQLAGKTLSTPQLGNTQDIALRTWLGAQGLDVEGDESPGDVKIVPQENGAILEAFRQGTIDGAWVPEPWLSRMIEEGQGHLLADDSATGSRITTLLMVRTQVLDERHDEVAALIEGLAEEIQRMNEDPADAIARTAAELTALTGTEVAPELIEKAWTRLTFSTDLDAAQLSSNAHDAAELGFVSQVDITGAIDLSLLLEGQA